MPEESDFAALRDAVTQATVGTDVTLDFTESSSVVSTLVIKQLHVTYERGNEYLRLDRLYKALQGCGNVVVFEFRGRGVTPSKEPTLVADLQIAGQSYQVIYHLPGSGQNA